MELNKEQLTKLKGYICNINFDHELYGVEKTVKLLGIESAELNEIITNKTIDMKTRKHYNRLNNKRRKNNV